MILQRQKNFGLIKTLNKTRKNQYLEKIGLKAHAKEMGLSPLVLGRIKSSSDKIDNDKIGDIVNYIINLKGSNPHLGTRPEKAFLRKFKNK